MHAYVSACEGDRIGTYVTVCIHAQESYLFLQQHFEIYKVWVLDIHTKCIPIFIRLVNSVCTISPRLHNVHGFFCPLPLTRSYLFVSHPLSAGW